jgi:hypothetical protein
VQCRDGPFHLEVPRKWKNILQQLVLLCRAQMLLLLRQVRLLLVVLGVDLKLLQLLSQQKGLYLWALVTLWVASV